MRNLSDSELSLSSGEQQERVNRERDRNKYFCSSLLQKSSVKLKVQYQSISSLSVMPHGMLHVIPYKGI